MNSTPALQSKSKNYVMPQEFILYLAAVFFYTTMTGMVGGYRQAYLVNILGLANNSVSLINSVSSILNFVLGFFYAMIIDNRKMHKSGKFRPVGMLIAIPAGILTMLMFYTPSGLTGTWLIIYLLVITLAQSASTTFGNVVNMVSYVMTPNNKERDKIISFRGIASAIGNSAPLLYVLVIAFFVKSEATQYIISAALCAVTGALSMLIGMKVIKERTVYNQKKQNPVLGFKDILTNKAARKYSWIIIISEFLKNFRGIATYMGVFLAAALLGSTSKYLLFGLPTGIGTAVGMLVINFLLKKFNAKQLYIASGIYSVLANVLAFAIGFIYFKSPNSALQILFIICLFLIGLQFGASNLLPSMFQADVLEVLELDTGKRLDASLPVVIGIGTTISGTIATALAPLILYGDHSIIQYIQPVNDVYVEQSFKTKILLLFFYTVFHGIMMLLAGLPFFFYKLTGKTKEDMHEALLEKRAELEEKTAE